MRAYNFCAGPAALPTAVLERAQTELADWHGRGLSIMEMSHRSDDFVGVAEKAEADSRTLLDIPSDYKVLFLQGGASLQFSAIPLNLLGAGQTADYIDTGIWSQKAIEEGKHWFKLEKEDKITLNIDFKQMGVGGNDSWTDVSAPLEKYQVPAENYHYSFHLIPMDEKSDVQQYIR